MRQIFYYKLRQLLQNTMILLHYATVVLSCDVDYTMHKVAGFLLFLWRAENLIIQ